jgi:hypothetical protein
MNLPCSVCTIQSVAVPDSSSVTSQTRVMCAGCCRRATLRKIASLESERRTVAQSLATPAPPLRRSLQRIEKTREWDGDTHLGSPRIEAEALAALVRTGRATAQDLRELIDIPNDLETVLHRFDEVTGLRTMNRILAWRKRVLVEFERIAA